MRSIPLMLTWELFNHKRSILIGCALSGLCLPLLMFAALRHEGPIPVEDPSMILTHLMMIQINAFTFGMGVIAAQGRPSRLFTYPIAVSSIVAWQMILAMLAVALETIAVTLLLNALFDLRWPIWGPAMFAAISVASLQAVMWLTEKSPWIVVSLSVVMGTLGIWFKSLHGAAFSLPTHFWREVTVVEVFLMLLVAGLAYATGLVGITRTRRGDPLGSLGIIAWFERQFDQAPQSVMRFSSATRAQWWLEWKRKGGVMPIAVLFAMLMGFCIWGVFIRSADDLIYGFVVGGAMLSVGGLLFGPMFGSDASRGDPSFDMTPFMATRPMTTSQMARISLRVGIESVFVGWAIWAVSFLVVHLVTRVLGVTPQLNPLADLAWWYFPATLLGPCVLLALGTCVGLAGRSAMFAKLLCAGIAAYLCGVLLVKFVLPSELFLPLIRAGAIMVGVLLLAGTVATFTLAYRRLLIGWPTIYVAATLWVGLFVMVALDRVLRQSGFLPLQVMIVGLASLSVAPLAAAPLALAWNRTR